MTIYFHKYQGTGNDFILVDDREEHFPISNSLIQKLCDRRFGIGADGLILLQNHPELDYKMIYFNSDGSQSLCGNGSRCGFAFAQSLGIVDQHATFETTDGIHKIKVHEGSIHFQLFDAGEIKEVSKNEWYVNTGSPHHIILGDDIESENIIEKGSFIRNSPVYASQNGTNVNFAQLLIDKVRLRTYERGVENETLSCGTGATAVGLLAGQLGWESPVRVATRGGELQVYFTKEASKFSNIWLAGPAEKVFEGSIVI